MKTILPISIGPSTNQVLVFGPIPVGWFIEELIFAMSLFSGTTVTVALMDRPQGLVAADLASGDLVSDNLAAFPTITTTTLVNYAVSALVKDLNKRYLAVSFVSGGAGMVAGTISMKAWPHV